MGMYNRESILKSLNSENYYIDKNSLESFLEDWKIESIYEDEDGIEFYDDLALDKIKKGISLKAQGYSDEQITVKLNKMEAKTPKIETDKLVQPILIKDYLENIRTDAVPGNEENSLPVEIPEEPIKNKNFTLDVSSQTLQMLAEAVAKKISDDITNSDWANKLIEAGGYKKDNEILAQQIKELLEHNKELSKRIEQLESHPSRSFWKRIWGRDK